MKKALSFLIVLIMLLGVLSISGTGFAAVSRQLGDSNKDGSVNIMDATWIQKYVIKSIESSRIDLTAADVDGDGVVTTRDCTIVQRFMAGMCEIDGTDPFGGEDNISLTVWAADNAVNLTRELCRSFKAKYPNKTIAIRIQTRDEGKAAASVLMDADRAADVFSFPCDQINRLNTGKVLAPVIDYYKQDVIDRNTEFSVSTATLDGELLAYPQTGENGYYLVYDKRYVSDEQAKTIEGVFEACKAADKRFLIDAGNGYYACIFPLTGGLRMAGLKTIDQNNYQIFSEYDEEEVVDALEAFAKLFHTYSDVFLSADTNRVASGMAENPSTIAAGIDGSWNASAVANVLGDNYGAAKLPTINIKGEDKQIYGLNGTKLIGVNSHSKYPHTAQLLANYLTGEEAQLVRAEQLNWLPSNKAVVESDAVKNNKALSALYEQSKYSVPQINIANTFWLPMGTLGNKLFKEDDYSRATLKNEFRRAINNICDDGWI